MPSNAFFRFSTGTEKIEFFASEKSGTESGTEQPGAILALQVSFCQRIFFHQEALGASVQLQDHFLYRRAGHPEDIRFFDLVLILEGQQALVDLHVDGIISHLDSL